MKLRYRIIELKHDLFEVQMQMVGFWGKVLGWCYVIRTQTIEAARESCYNNLRNDIMYDKMPVEKDRKKREKLIKIIEQYEPEEDEEH